VTLGRAGAVNLGAAAHCVDRGFECFARQPVLLGDTARFAFVVGDREKIHFARDIGVVELLRFLVGAVEQAGEIAADLDVAVGALNLRQARHGVFERGLQGLDLHARLRQQRARRTVLLRDQRRKQVNGFDILIVIADRETLRVGECFLELRR